MKKKIWCIVPAGGIGCRMGASRAKQFLPLKNGHGGDFVIECTLGALLAHPSINHIYLGVDYINTQDWKHYINEELRQFISVYQSGEYRVDTVLNGLVHILESGAQRRDWVLIHDAARPCLSYADLDRVIAAIKSPINDGGVILANRVTDTIKMIAEKNPTTVARTINRDELIAALTPQIFTIGQLFDSINTALSRDGKLDITDECSTMEMSGYSVGVVFAEDENIKITYPKDLEYAQWVLKNKNKKRN